MPQNILHTNKQGEKLLHRSVWFVESLEKLYTGGGGVHSWFLMCVYLLRLLGTLKENKKKREFKFFIDALSLQHFNLEGT